MGTGTLNRTMREEQSVYTRINKVDVYVCTAHICTLYAIAQYVAVRRMMMGRWLGGSMLATAMGLVTIPTVMVLIVLAEHGSHIHTTNVCVQKVRDINATFSIGVKRCSIFQWYLITAIILKI